MKLVAGVAGFARHGKDEIGKHLIRDYDFERYAFADPLKRACAEMFGIPLEHFYSMEFKEKENEFWGFSPREMAQLLGTEGGRELFRDDIWVRRAQMEFDNLNSNLSGMVITDVRFENEAAWVREMGGVMIHVYRPGYEDHSVGKANHASEAGLEAHSGDFSIVNDGTIADLQFAVDEVMAKAVLRRMPEYHQIGC